MTDGKRLPEGRWANGNNVVKVEEIPRDGEWKLNICASEVNGICDRGC